MDAIVNAASRALAGGGGVDGAIHAAAGPELVRASRALGPIETGSAVITPGFRLPARYVIHAVGPIWHGGEQGEAELLERAYETSFERAHEAGDVRTIAFPAISAGVYGYPKESASRDRGARDAAPRSGVRAHRRVRVRRADGAGYRRSLGERSRLVFARTVVLSQRDDTLIWW